MSDVVYDELFDERGDCVECDHPWEEHDEDDDYYCLACGDYCDE